MKRDAIQRLKDSIRDATRIWGGQTFEESRALMSHIDFAIDQWVKAEARRKRAEK